MTQIVITTVSASEQGLVITALTATAMTCAGTVSESAGAGKTLSVGLPSRRAWENVAFAPEPGAPYVEEQFVPGPTTMPGVGPGGTLEMLPLYAEIPTGAFASAVPSRISCIRSCHRVGMCTP